MVVYAIGHHAGIVFFGCNITVFCDAAFYHIGHVKEIDFESYIVLKAENDADPYLHCKSKREQNQIEGFLARSEPDEFNIAKRQKKNTRNAEYKLRKSRCAEYDAKRKIFEYYIS